MRATPPSTESPRPVAPRTLSVGTRLLAPGGLSWLEHRLLLPVRLSRAGGFPAPRVSQPAVRADRHDCPRPPPRPVRIADVGAPGPALQLLPPRFQVPLHPAETGWRIGGLKPWQRHSNGRATRRGGWCAGCGIAANSPSGAETTASSNM